MGGIRFIDICYFAYILMQQMLIKNLSSINESNEGFLYSLESDGRQSYIVRYDSDGSNGCQILYGVSQYFVDKDGLYTVEGKKRECISEKKSCRLGSKKFDNLQYPC